jgi:hypothetical protein
VQVGRDDAVEGARSMRRRWRDPSCARCDRSMFMGEGAARRSLVSFSMLCTDAPKRLASFLSIACRARRAAAANQGCSTRAKARQLENRTGAKQQCVKNRPSAAVRFTAPPGAGTRLPNFAWGLVYLLFVGKHTSTSPPPHPCGSPTTHGVGHAPSTLAPHRLRVGTKCIGRAPLSHDEHCVHPIWRNLSGFMRKRGCSHP